MTIAGFECLGLIEVRNPLLNSYYTDHARGWHTDTRGSGFMRAMWSNVRPTEVRFTDGRLLGAQDGDVILIDNSEVEHRAPEDQQDRWFIRTSVAEIKS